MENNEAAFMLKRLANFHQSNPRKRDSKSASKLDKKQNLTNLKKELKPGDFLKVTEILTDNVAISTGTKIRSADVSQQAQEKDCQQGIKPKLETRVAPQTEECQHPLNQTDAHPQSEKLDEQRDKSMLFPPVPVVVKEPQLTKAIHPENYNRSAVSV